MKRPLHSLGVAAAMALVMSIDPRPLATKIRSGPKKQDPSEAESKKLAAQAKRERKQLARRKV